MIGQKATLPPVDGDTRRWYIPGRTRDFKGRYSLSADEFHSISGLYPLVAQLKDERYECACISSADEQQIALILCALRSYEARRGSTSK